MSLVTDLRARLAVAEETDGPVLLLPAEARYVLAALEAAEVAVASVALALVFADEKATP